MSLLSGKTGYILCSVECISVELGTVSEVFQVFFYEVGSRLQVPHDRNHVQRSGFFWIEPAEECQTVHSQSLVSMWQLR